MKRILIYIQLVAFGLLSGLVFAQDIEITKVGEWGAGSYSDVAIQGNYAYCAASGAGLDIIDITNPRDPVKKGNYDTPGSALAAAVKNNYAYVADYDGGLQIIDVSTPAAPTAAGSYVTGGTVHDVCLSGNYAYIVGDNGLEVIDVSDPQAPVRIGRELTSWRALSVAVSGQYAYVSVSGQGIYIYDVSTPSSPSFAAGYGTGYVIGLYVLGDRLYAAADRDEVWIIDVSDPTSPKSVDSFQTTGRVNDIFVRGDYAYVADDWKGLVIADLTKINSENGRAVVETESASGVFLSGNNAYVADGTGGLQVIGVSTPLSPTKTGSYDASWWPVDFVVKDNTVYVADWWWTMNIIDVSDPYLPRLTGKYTTDTNATGVGQDGNYAYLTQFGALKVIDVSIPPSLSVVGEHDIPSYPGGVYVDGNYAYVADGICSLRIIDVSNPAAPTLTGFCVSPGEALGVFVIGNYAYLADGNEGLQVIDVSDKTVPTLLGGCDTPGYANGVYVSGNYAYVSDGWSGVAIIDITDPNVPVSAGKIDMDMAVAVHVHGNYAYVAGDEENGVRIYNVSNPASPVLAGQYDNTGKVEDVYGNGEYIYLLDSEGGKLLVLKMSDPGTFPWISIDRDSMVFASDTSGNVTGTQTVFVENTGGGTMNWTAAVDRTWLHCSPAAGTGGGEISVSVDTAGLSPGTYTGTVTVSAPEAVNSPQTVTVTLNVYRIGQTSAPFGMFATPVTGSTVSGSVPVTGWALDDIGVQRLQIYREGGSALIYIGDAVFVEGARPDVEKTYPGYPNNTKAGWGYMLLTNFLPDGGNGTFTLHAAAVDVEGNQVTLGTTVITCDNANAVEPFGAIDTPAQGGTASGSGYRNQGWVLTPMPNMIPTDGSTISVYVDGVFLGHPTYNVYREDIAQLFPGYANSGGALAYFDFDTAAFTNGLHTIHWTAEDDAGNIDGIGSRYFVVQNTQSAERTKDEGRKRLPGFETIPIEQENPRAVQVGTPRRVDWLSPVDVVKGFRRDIEPSTAYPDENGVINIEIRELERVEIHLMDSPTAVFPLPIGSYLDPESGTFCWQPGVGFNGMYRFEFITRTPGGETTQKTVKINILPKYM